MPESIHKEQPFDPGQYEYGDSFSSQELKRFENEPGKNLVGDEEVLRYLGENPNAETVKKMRSEGKSWSDIALVFEAAAAKYAGKLDRKEFDDDKDEADVLEDIETLREVARVAAGADRATGTKVYGELNKVARGPSGEARLFEQLDDIQQSGNKLAQAVLNGLKMTRRQGYSYQEARRDMDELMEQYVEKYKNEFGLQRVLEDERQVKAVLDRWLSAADKSG